ncbi:glycoside hydrolase family 47 protein [Truncatella angustata]|uniref:alpha-1,2-Mannosidase n=1 Tax=Truncatella angustata TaxID=152316 RepID=A0A9P8ZVQ6_9PEZI|nr:glycoside hydrolase family 47 protein [Truncatella angustata]KAH6652245.1 glycoside hydrolase family 47 protein [Truncatella angustata]
MARDELYRVHKQPAIKFVRLDGNQSPDVASDSDELSNASTVDLEPTQTKRFSPKIILIAAVCGLVVIAAIVGGLVGAASKRSGNADNKVRGNYTSNPERAATVKDAFRHAWNGYYEFAFPHDSLKPISKTYVNDRNGWSASAIDALSTAIIMEDEDTVRQIVDYIPKINFDKVSDVDRTVSLFETTIRYMGGLLSAHDLLSASMAEKFHVNDTILGVILDQATHLADNLKVAFNTPTGIPINELLFEPPRVTDRTTNGLAAFGSLVLEWTRLSDKTGRREYAELAQKAQSYLLRPTPEEIGEPWPGLRGTRVAIENGSFVDSSGGWSGSDDSYYEYLIKMYMYDTDRFNDYKNNWTTAADSSIKYLASHPSTRPDLTFLAAYAEKDNFTYVSGHLACFAGGTFILGGLALDRQDYVDFGLKLAYSCHELYTGTSTGIGPDVFAWKDDRSLSNATYNPEPPSDQLSFYSASGFWITGRDYQLRPEAIESWYYAYRATGDTMYQDWAWDAFKAINTTCFSGAGLTAISDVNAIDGGSFLDSQESFVFAEVLKYSYLIQAEEGPWQVSASHDNQFVFNTEGHPFKVAGRPI